MFVIAAGLSRLCVLRGRLMARALYSEIPLMFCATVALGRSPIWNTTVAREATDDDDQG